MRSLANGVQSVAPQVSDGAFGGCEEGVVATEFSAAMTPVAWQDLGTGARERVLAGLCKSMNQSSISILLIFRLWKLNFHQ